MYTTSHTLCITVVYTYTTWHYTSAYMDSMSHVNVHFKSSTPHTILFLKLLSSTILHHVDVLTIAHYTLACMYSMSFVTKRTNYTYIQYTIYQLVPGTAINVLVSRYTAHQLASTKRLVLMLTHTRLLYTSISLYIHVISASFNCSLNNTPHISL